MTEKEILQFNMDCAKFLGLTIITNYIIYVITYNSLIINKLRHEKSKDYKDL